MDYVEPNLRQVAATLVVLFTANNTIVDPVHPVVGWFAGAVFLVAGAVLVVQGYGAYLAWETNRGRSTLGE